MPLVENPGWLANCPLCRSAAMMLVSHGEWRGKKRDDYAVYCTRRGTEPGGDGLSCMRGPSALTQEEAADRWNQLHSDVEVF